MGYTANNREYALLLRHPQPRPWLVCVHGTEMGRAALDLALFRAWRLHEDLSRTETLSCRSSLTEAADEIERLARAHSGS